MGQDEGQGQDQGQGQVQGGGERAGGRGGEGQDSEKRAGEGAEAANETQRCQDIADTFARLENMGVALSPYRVLGERPPAEALRALPVIEVRAPLVLSANATFEDEDFAAVRYVAGSNDARGATVGANNFPLWLYLVAGFTAAFGSVAAWAMFGGR